MSATWPSWKLVLDHWFIKDSIGRGLVFGNIAANQLYKSVAGGTSGLPAFFRKALESYKLLTPVPIRPDSVTSKDEALAEPVWCSHIIKSDQSHHTTWRGELQLNRVSDIVSDAEESEARGVDGVDYLRNYIRRTLQTAGDYVIVANRSQKKYISIMSLLKQYARMLDSIPSHIIDVALGEAPEPIRRISNVALSMMHRMGWRGGGLGINEQGVTSPVKGKTSLNTTGHRKEGPIHFTKSTGEMAATSASGKKSKQLHFYWFNLQGVDQLACPINDKNPTYYRMQQYLIFISNTQISL